jgi:ATP-dependent helicase YprA (DUF1998 family)
MVTVGSFLESLTSMYPETANAIEAKTIHEARIATFCSDDLLAELLDPLLVAHLKDELKIARLYMHQAEGITALLKDRQHVVVTTSTSRYFLNRL